MSNSIKYYHYRIIYRPRIEIFEENHIEIFAKLFRNETRHILAKESANTNSTINHIDMYIEFKKDIRKDKLKEKIFRTLKKEEIKIEKTEKNIAVRIQAIKNNVDGTIGYSLKEDNEKLIKGFTEKELEYYKNQYIENTIVNFNKKHCLRVTKKNIHIYFKLYIKNNDIQIKYIQEKVYETIKIPDPYYKNKTIDKKIEKLQDSTKIDPNWIIHILGEMGNNDYSLLWIDRKNIIPIVDYLKCNLEKEMETYFKSILSEAKRWETI